MSNIENKEKKNISNLDKNEIKNKYFYLKNKLEILEINSNKQINQVQERINKDIENTYKFYLENFFLQILPIVDSLESALKLLKNSKLENNNFFANLVNSTLTLFFKIFSEFNINLIDTNNMIFDPSIHQAIAIVNSDIVKHHHIIETIQNGYTIHSRLLRPSMVIVSQNK